MTRPLSLVVFGLLAAHLGAQSAGTEHLLRLRYAQFDPTTGTPEVRAALRAAINAMGGRTDHEQTGRRGRQHDPGQRGLYRPDPGPEQ